MEMEMDDCCLLLFFLAGTEGMRYLSSRKRRTGFSLEGKVSFEEGVDN